MRTQFKIGQSVTLLDDDLSGIITQISAEAISIITSDGFEFDVNAHEIVPDKTLDLDFDQNLDSLIKEKESFYKKRKKPVAKAKGVVPPMEVDLHIHQLTKSERGMTAHDKLNLQIDTARRKLEFAINKRIQRVVFIHGVGEGVLKAELEYLFSRYDTIKFYDANYQRYGLGATEVYIYQNPE
ncbi:MULTISPECIES: Smr/MutS family protein [Leeuwenhoekiella]|jgi:DNA-nicking Smr family endonuclease|uniref:Smr domain-containing protein n=1 Tax=Leeuwenhoekiella blandensis (strain CECT 7118 / CCUG 51940 / KCTC 22103 / MED217) TaxID=398720 RepID=A3XNI1_LEEBM|nr:MULTISPECIES: Smr/MutS family protein [Leeuwenhoekiella]EAQ48889.1 hypothetical protein MED217_10082 [Leeuwenhoekiella blandensis MED217]MAO44770.1 DNA mismatch repair protein MutS [Leeuwenhoekiella sp.]HBT11157.1 DNA mismatch repair protein MutS [Leeuwenhoekiella sp.]HCW65553.1 DNA mismatch repair protein MutS [Leeuwenhoekiella sp.]|tara:strand:+ start:39595 stop:40143 length:549 start_codon:yes stop_codon:yes gene_type:complete